MLSYPVWSSSVEYIHIQCNTVFFSFIWKRGMQFGADPSSQVQWLSCMVLSSSIQGSGVCWILSWSYDSPVQSTPLTWGPVHSVESAPVRSSPVQSNPVRSLPAKYISIQRSPGPYKSMAVESSPVKCSAQQCNPNSSAQSRPVQSRTTNCHRV